MNQKQYKLLLKIRDHVLAIDNLVTELDHWSENPLKLTPVYDKLVSVFLKGEKK